MKHISKTPGFTLIELLVVIVILGILSTISVGTFRSYFAKARDSERVSAVQSVAMMIKVDSGGLGDCGVYNYTDGLDGRSKTNTENACPTTVLGDLSKLLTENDYSMPEEKNGLGYFYGFKLGDVEGDNDFFIVIGAEEDVPQNGKEIASTGNFVFVDGTITGVNIVTTIQAVPADGCQWDPLDKSLGCGEDWQVFSINQDGTLGS